MLKRIINYLKNNQIDCHTDKSALNDRVCHYGRFAFYQKSAFTLAETLIVMGIIGVVAALTLPNLNSSTGDKEKVVKLKKIYQNLSDAYGRAVVVYGPSDEWCTNYTGNCVQRRAERLMEFLKITKTCGFSANGACFNSSQTNTLNGAKASSENRNVYYGFVTADGTSMSVSPYQGVVIDIDGPIKGSNTWGKDIFIFDIDLAGNVGIYPSGFGHSDNDLKNYCFRLGQGCAGWVIQNENMDYLKADRTGKCPNNTQLSWTNTSCN